MIKWSTKTAPKNRLGPILILLCSVSAGDRFSQPPVTLSESSLCSTDSPAALLPGGGLCQSDRGARSHHHLYLPLPRAAAQQRGDARPPGQRAGQLQRPLPARRPADPAVPLPRTAPGDQTRQRRTARGRRHLDSPQGKAAGEFIMLAAG